MFSKFMFLRLNAQQFGRFFSEHIWLFYVDVNNKSQHAELNVLPAGPQYFYYLVHH